MVRAGPAAGVAEAVAAHVHGRVGAQGAGEDADEGDPADVRVGRGLHDLGEQGGRRISDGKGARGAVLGGDRRKHVFRGGGEAAGDQVQEFHGPDALARALERGSRGEDRVEGAACDGSLQVVEEGRDVDPVAGEVAVHQGLVLALGDDPLDEPVTCLLQGAALSVGGRSLPPFPRRVVEDPLGEKPGESGERGVPVRSLVPLHGHVQGEHGVGVVVSEDPAADPGQLVEGRTRGVQVRDDDGRRHADGRALLPERPRGARHRVGLLGGRHDEEGRVRRAQTGPDLPDEVRVAGCVQQVDPVALPVDGDQRELHGTPSALFRLVVVGDGRAVLDPAGPVQGAGGQRQRLHQGGLARAAVADQRDVPYGIGRPAVTALPAAPVCVRVLSPMTACLPIGGVVPQELGCGCTGEREPPRRLRRRPRSFELFTRAGPRPYGGRGGTGLPGHPAGRGAPPVPGTARDYDGPAGGRRGRGAHRTSGRPC